MIVTPLAEHLASVRGRVQIALDEGGIRCTGRSGVCYLPFSHIEDVRLERGIFGRARLVVTAVGGTDLVVPLASENPLAIHGAIAEHLAERRRARGGPEVVTPPEWLARGDRDAATWLANVSAHAHGGAYRDANAAPEVLARVLGDPHAAIDARASAGYALLAAGEDQELPRVVEAFVQHALPPLVLVAARTAPEGQVLVDDELLQELEAFLPEADRTALASLRLAMPPSDGMRAETLRRAKAVAIDGALRAHAAAAVDTAPKRRHREFRISGAVDPGRWIGRTWN